MLLLPFDTKARQFILFFLQLLQNSLPLVSTRHQLSTGLRAQPRGGMTSTGATLRCFLLPLWWWGWSCCLSPNNAELQRFDRPTKPDGSLSFLVVGDWGRRGSFNQSRVASQMGRIGEKLGVDFVVSTGDNFYDDGLTGVDDPAFEESFTKIYTAPSLQKQWYSVLGNHDYRGDAEAQSSPMLTQIDWRWLCLRSFIVNAESAEIFFVDTTPFVRSYFTDSKGHTYDWRAIRSRKAYMRQVIEDLASALRESAATWKIVVAHHAIRSIGHHGDTEELVQLLLPILRANNVDFYLNGHDHCLEHIHDEDSRIQFLTSGAGSKAWRGDIKDITREGLQFFYDGQGFMSVWLSRTEAEIVFYNVDGEVLHRFSVPKDSHQIHMKGRRGKNYIVTLAGKLKRNDQL